MNHGDLVKLKPNSTPRGDIRFYIPSSPLSPLEDS
jgi:hypothetical protein